mgnify:CR=1 FL=1
MLDLNSQENYFNKLISAFLVDISSIMSLRGSISIPHFIPNTGDDTIYLMDRGYNGSLEPCEITNQANVYYQRNPRCVCQVGGINLLNDQLTSPFVRGIGTIEDEDDEGNPEVTTYSAQFRRYPVQVSIDCKYVVPTFNDVLWLTQHIITSAATIRTFKFVYLGQVLSASYRLPDAYQGEFPIEIDGTSQEDRNKTVSISLEIESNLPVYDNDTVVKTDKVILKTIGNIKHQGTLATESPLV